MHLVGFINSTMHIASSDVRSYNKQKRACHTIHTTTSMRHPTQDHTTSIRHHITLGTKDYLILNFIKFDAFFRNHPLKKP